MKKSIQSQSKLHPRNKHQGKYDFDTLVKHTPELRKFLIKNIIGEVSIDFSDAKAVKTLNKALLKLQYNIEYWDIPNGYLCPPIPGRADYIHYMASWLQKCNLEKMPRNGSITCIDIGVGANLIYPIIGVTEYGWSFIGTDIDENSLSSAQIIIDLNPNLKGRIELRRQNNVDDIFKGILSKDDRIDLSVCNPPFHASAEDAQLGSNRKVSNLSGKKVDSAKLNFGGQSNELWCQGGELRFILDYIYQSREFSNCCFWYSTLVSKQANLKSIYSALNKHKAVQVETIPMAQGNKVSRIVTWTFLTEKQQEIWRKMKWNSK
ncbi:23S rRNA (adenine(1618)-N(6))-methyltransferase RlmF [Reichenbachiella versicolor]|uniref:23S rRNA (adenine(1618)-N(6))-methyltransferase RlmF n=1 Tax=Reichenbachiella versicolor TaxID=1821036 RepID=UPI000D6E61AE|nr:23S rRNA (adenine(1618)-N(6))-methyltransferase RlmF [Reichenbachiella versicolor]